MRRSVSITHMSSFQKIKIKIITQWRATSASGWGQGCFVENLYIIELESKLFFIEVKPELAQITGDKNVLTLTFLTESLLFELHCIFAYFQLGNYQLIFFFQTIIYMCEIRYVSYYMS